MSLSECSAGDSLPKTEIRNPDKHSDQDPSRLLHLVSILLPKCNQDTLQVLFVFLKWVASFAHVDESGNKMDLQNLSTVLAPNLLYSKRRDAARDDAFSSIRVVTEFLERQDELYTVPEEFMDILRDQEYFAAALELPGKDFLKKIDSYMKIKSGGRGPSGLMSPVLNGSHSPFHPQGPPFMGTPTSGHTTLREDKEVRLVPQRSDPALSRGRTIANDGQLGGNYSPRRQRHDSRSLERSEEPISPGYNHTRHMGGSTPGSGPGGSKLAPQHPGLQHQSASHPGYSTVSQFDPPSAAPSRPPRPTDMERPNVQFEMPARLSGDYTNSYSPTSEPGSNHPLASSRHRI